MTMAAAQKFVQRVLWDSELVTQINSAPDHEALARMLAELEMSFNYDEFEQACRYWLVQCQTHEQAELIEGIKTWWNCLGMALQRSDG